MQLKQYILENIDQRLIFSKYLNVSINDINYCLTNRTHKISNPLRNDSNPSLSFKYYNDKLIARDFADSRYRGDVFEIAALIINKNVNNGIHFNDICRDIIDTCLKDSTKNVLDKAFEELKLKSVSLDIQIEERRLNRFDYDLFNKWGIERCDIEEFITPCDTYSLIDEMGTHRSKYKYSTTDPCYSYIVNPNKTKLYFPFRSKKDVRFITNNRFPIENYSSIINSDCILLLKSQKDKLLFKRLLRDFSIPNYEVQIFSTASETIKLNNLIKNHLFSKSSKIYCLFDTDEPGYNSANYLKESTNIQPIFFTEGLNVKDPTDMVAAYGYDKVKQRFESILKTQLLCY